MGGRRGTGGPRAPPCPDSPSAGSEMATEGQTTQEPSVTSQANGEERRLPRKAQGAPTPSSCAPSPSQSPHPTHLWAQSPLQPHSHCSKSKPPSYGPWVSTATPKWPTYFHLLPATNALSPLQPERDFFSASKFFIRKRILASCSIQKSP